MATPFPTELQKPFGKLFAQGNWGDYISALSEKGMAWFLELDFPRLVGHLMPLNSMPPEVARPARLTFFADMIEPYVDEATVARHFESFLADGDLEAAAGAAAFGLNLALEKGDSYARFTPWHQRCERLLEKEPGLSPLARSCLLLQLGMKKHLFGGDMKKAEQVFFQALRLAEAAGSDSLRLHTVASIAYVSNFLGQFAKAEMLCFDAASLCGFPYVSDLAKLSFQMQYATLHCFKETTDKGKSILAQLTSDPYFDCLPPTIWLYAQSHYMLAATWTGATEEALAIAKRIQELVVPEQNYYFRAFIQFNLTVANMLVGDYAKAWIHITESERLGEIHGIPQAGILNALAIGLILGELGKTRQALDHLARWHGKWLESGCFWVAAAGDIETASILAGRGELDRARELFKRAESLMPEGNATQYLRPLVFTEKLRRKLFPGKAPLITLADWQEAPICIETFGDLLIRVNHKTVVDRKRQGRRTKELLKALIVLGGKDVSSDRLQDMLWPDASGEKAAKSLKSAIFRLKRAGLEPEEKPLPWIKVKERRVSLDPSLCSVDSLLFSEAISAHPKQGIATDLIRQALDLYKEDFLAQDVQEAWIIRHREYLRKMFIEGAAALARRLMEKGDAAGAVPYLEKALELNPVHEPTYSILMEIHLNMGYPAQTLQVYEQAKTRLQEELHIQPGPDLTSLAKKAGLKD